LDGPIIIELGVVQPFLYPELVTNVRSSLPSFGENISKSDLEMLIPAVAMG
jgi:hypothetical protein